MGSNNKLTNERGYIPMAQNLPADMPFSEELLSFFENILALAQSLQILAVAPDYGAGELMPVYLQRIASIITSSCHSGINILENYQI